MTETPFIYHDKSEYSPVKASLEPKRVNVDFPAWVIQELDKEAKAIGISRQALIKTWIVDRIKSHRT